jgi:hypothetical protein
MRISPASTILTIAVSSFVALGNHVVNASSPARRSHVMPGMSMQPLAAAAAAPDRQVSMMDACDGPTFNLIVGPGTCARPDGVAFPDFIAQLIANQFAGAWHFAPGQTDAWLGDTLIAVNKGGEVHSFTRVAQFGGGVVDVLNVLSQSGPIVPECIAESTYVPPGGTDSESLDQTGELKFQCCIHPWMHTTVQVKSR